MNEARRERVRELIKELESAQVRVHALLIDEENAFEGRSPASKETDSGNTSSDAVYHLDQAANGIQTAIEEMQYAVGDDSLPEPVAPPIKRR